MRDSLGFAGFVFLYINAGVFVEVSVFLSHGSRINVATFFFSKSFLHKDNMTNQPFLVMSFAKNGNQQHGLIK